MFTFALVSVSMAVYPGARMVEKANKLKENAIWLRQIGIPTTTQSFPAPTTALVFPAPTLVPDEPSDGFLKPEQSFLFNVECNGWEDCDNAETTLADVGALIAKELKFKIPVNVCVNVSEQVLPDEFETTFPQHLDRSTNDNVVGELLAYPDLITKQVNADAIKNYFKALRKTVPKDESCDMNIAFSKATKFNFDSAIRANSIDFQLAMAQEITKGLGFSSNLKVNGGKVYPKLLSDKNGQKYFSKMSVFDSLIYAPKLQETPSPVEAPIKCFKGMFGCTANVQEQVLPSGEPEIIPISAIFDKFNNTDIFTNPKTDIFSPSIEPIANELGQTTEQGIKLQFSDGTNLMLDSLEFGHVHRNLRLSKEFLMASTGRLIKGLTLKEGLGLNDGKIYGPQTLKALKAIGYATADDRRMIEFTEELE